VIGLVRTGRYFSNKLHHNHWLPNNIIGMVNGYNQDIPESIHKQLAFPLLGELANIKSIIQTHAVKRVYISLSLKHAEKVERLNEFLLDSQAGVIYVLDISDFKSEYFTL